MSTSGSNDVKDISASIASSVVVSFVVVKKDVSWSGLVVALTNIVALVVAFSSFVVIAIAVAVAVVVAVVSVFDAVEWSVLTVVETESLIQKN